MGFSHAGWTEEVATILHNFDAVTMGFAPWLGSRSKRILSSRDAIIMACWCFLLGVLLRKGNLVVSWRRAVDGSERREEAVTVSVSEAKLILGLWIDTVILHATTSSLNNTCCVRGAT